MDHSEGRRVALVSGASSGIGRAIASALGELGWAVAVGARRRERLADVAEEIRAAGGEPCIHELDVTDPASVDEFFDASEAALGPVDVLVNNAGISIPGKFHELAVEDLAREVATNLLGPMYLTRRAIGSMLARHGGGDLVFISSDASRQPRPRMVAYTATKAGLELMARSLSMELEGTGIRSTTVRVGPTLSEFAFGWDMERVDELLEYWPRFGLQRHDGVMDAGAVARAVVMAVTTPPGVHIDTIEVQPEAPSNRAPSPGFQRPPT